MKTLITLAAVTIVTAAVAADPAQPTPEEKREAKIWAAVGDLCVKRDGMRRYVMVAQGEVIDHQPAELYGSVIIKLTDVRRDYDLTAHVQYHPGRRERLQCYIYNGEKEQTFFNLRETEPLTRPPKEAKKKPWEANFDDYKKFKAPGCPPFDAAIVGTFMARNSKHPRYLENYVLRQFELVETEPPIGGHYVAKFDWDSPLKLKFRYTVEFSQAHDWLPVKIDGKGTGDRGTYTTAARYEWKRHRRQMLPYRARWAQDQNLTLKNRQGQVMKFKTGEEMAYVYQWLVDDQVPDDLFEAPNPVAAVLDHFDIPYSYDHRVAAVYEAPADLYPPSPDD